MREILVSIIMGSDSDLSVMAESAKVLDEFGIGYELSLVSAHRTPHRMFKHAKNASKRSFKVIIAGASGAAHLPGMIAAISILPVIGVPVQSKTMSGVDSLYSIVQMPPGVPVATMAINGAKNAGLLAVQILALSDRPLAKRLEKYKIKMASEVSEKAKKLEKMGFAGYLKDLEIKK